MNGKVTPRTLSGFMELPPEEQMLFDEQGLYMVRDFTLWEQIYYLSFDGKTQKCLTEGRNWDIKLLKLDKKKGELYFTSKKEKCTRVDIYKVSIKKAKTTRIAGIMQKRFAEQAKALICKDIKTGNDGKAFTSCDDCIRIAVRLVEEELGL